MNKEYIFISGKRSGKTMSTIEILNKLAEETEEPFTCEKCGEKSYMRFYIPLRQSIRCGVVCETCYNRIINKFKECKK